MQAAETSGNRTENRKEKDRDRGGIYGMTTQPNLFIFLSFPSRFACVPCRISPAPSPGPKISGGNNTTLGPLSDPKSIGMMSPCLPSFLPSLSIMLYKCAKDESRLHPFLLFVQHTRTRARRPRASERASAKKKCAYTNTIANRTEPNHTFLLVQIALAP
ncbi:hypothetical protein K505DRAFT_62183 [Melanomma pulvis-pyrius CBS 109.77]|uniref:Uncharacterized protein n=1 Tax=Melanomma pulvis-pyrius CBS 109.77 TaxID=1314802 RepID=A0A6A6X6L4_9PLEO|nr:hypothetical protein K505DRAFT_62183 [Melanomma pulvis-pyrius CBS 109.77]